MKNSKIQLITLAIMIIGLLATQSFAQQESKEIRVKFKKGKYSRTYTGSVSHSTNLYILGARKGQTLTVKIKSSDGAVFDVT